eukprot:CAMPEP_0174934132 /NCGR_PEP_ID=MMETSP1355-20121228/48390_1 /TAXON_ID=464990 /ORGANISM="Hemiselmis tepida, Strain CCMP443" /LENGTH=310 /DNA_ID=CAMNT_0016180703 /DNA_START=11 /DNA_END=939 /DNA_ORIENTATION=-
MGDEAPRPMVTDSGGEISMSIEETNKVRASLGLKPLDMTPAKAPKEGSKDAPIDAAKERAEAEAEREADAMRKKIADMKKQRMSQKKVMSAKTLGEASDDEEEDVAAWVTKARKKQKQAADALAKRMAEEDEAAEQGDYSASDLKGMKVLHDADTFNEGETVILTLADSRLVKRENGEGYINEEEDELENVGMSENDKRLLAKERAKKRAKYVNADDDEFTEGGKSKSMLSKYDDFVVDGEKVGGGLDRKSVRLGDQGEADLTKEQRQEAIRAKLAQAPGKVIVSLAGIVKEESDYQTKEEAQLAAFSKR